MIKIPKSNHPAKLDSIFGRSEQRLLTFKGIYVYGLRYNSQELTSLLSRRSDKIRVEVRINETDLGHIIVLPMDKTQMIKVPALLFDYAKGLTIKQQLSSLKLFRELKFNPAILLKAKLDISN